jgi:hypothetical protein
MAGDVRRYDYPGAYLNPVGDRPGSDHAADHFVA